MRDYDRITWDKHTHSVGLSGDYHALPARWLSEGPERGYTQ